MAHEKPKINESLIQPFHDALCISAVYMVMDQRVVFLQISGGLCQKRDGFCFTASDIDFTVDVFIGRGQLRFCLLHPVYQLFRPFPQKQPIVGKRYFFTAADEQLLS